MNQLKRLALTPLVLWKHGSPYPSSIRLGPAGTKVHLNPADDRAFKKLVMDTARGRESTPMQFWREHAAIHARATMLDIGANYGECIFSPAYQQQTCIAIEANPGLCEYLERSRRDHCHVDRISIVNALLGARQAADVPFYFYPNWTGGGSGVAPLRDGAQRVHVSETTLDKVLDQHSVDYSEPLLFKIDVEGFEAKVFRGFQQIDRFEKRLGILEFDTEMIERSGESPAAFFADLIQSHTVFLSRLRSRHLLRLDSWKELAERYDGHFHCDLVVTSSLDLLAPQWRAQISVPNSDPSAAAA